MAHLDDQPWAQPGVLELDALYLVQWDTAPSSERQPEWRIQVERTVAQHDAVASAPVEGRVVRLPPRRLSHGKPQLRERVAVEGEQGWQQMGEFSGVYGLGVNLT